MRWIAVTTVVLMLTGAFPAVDAAHWSLHDSEVDDFAARTMEDDGEVFPAGIAGLSGRANAVVPVGREVGDGSPLLDAMVGTAYVQGPAIYPGAFAADFAGPRILLPGPWSSSAWYGEWNDLDRDGIIDDIHDAQNAATDEFRWKGAASGEQLEVALYYPAPSANRAYRQTMEDRTDPTNPYQEWSPSTGFDNAHTDEGFLETWPTLTVAGAPRVIGHPLGYDLDHPNALIDVDIYTGMSSDVETLYVAVAEYVGREVSPLVAQGVGLALGTTFLVAGTVLGLAEDVPVDGIPVPGGLPDPLQTYAESQRMITPADAREPSTAEDDFGGRALFGGVGDLAGSGNTYDGYADGFHLWADTRARAYACGGVYASVPGISLAYQDGLCWASNYHPTGELAGDGRTHGLILGLQVQSLLWRDRNGDGHVGDVCDTADPASFDAAANACNDAPHPWPHSLTGGEVVRVCSSTTAKGGKATLTPMGANWPGVIILKDASHSTRIAYDGAPERVTDARPIDLRFDQECSGNAVLPRDLLAFPQGAMTVPIRVETVVDIAGWSDLTQGIELGAERVVDVDVIPAGL